MKLRRIALVPVCLAAVSLFQSVPAYAQMDRQGLSFSPQAGVIQLPVCRTERVDHSRECHGCSENSRADMKSP